MEQRHACLWYIRELRFFPQLDDDQMRELANRSRMVPVKKRQRISLQEIGEGEVFLIKEGRVRSLESVQQDRVVGTDVLGPGDMVGIASLLTAGGDSESFEVLEDGLVCVVQADVLTEILAKSAAVTLHVAKWHGLRMRRIENRLLDLVFCTVPVRLARTLLDLAERFGRPQNGATKIDLVLTHQQYADLVGANREAVTRALNGFVDCGVLRYDGRRVVIGDLAHLKRLAER